MKTLNSGTNDENVGKRRGICPALLREPKPGRESSQVLTGRSLRAFPEFTCSGKMRARWLFLEEIATLEHQLPLQQLGKCFSRISSKQQ